MLSEAKNAEVKNEEVPPKEVSEAKNEAAGAEEAK